MNEYRLIALQLVENTKKPIDLQNLKKLIIVTIIQTFRH